MDQDVAAKEQPRYIKLNDRDNVAIVVNDFGLPAGSRFGCGLTLRAFVPQGHKTALVDIAEGAPIIRYGEIIGYALSPILAGEWVDEARIRMPEAPTSTSSKSRPPCRRRCRRSKALRSRAIAIPTDRSARKTFWASPPPCNASRGRWNMR